MEIQQLLLTLNILRVQRIFVLNAQYPIIKDHCDLGSISTIGFYATTKTRAIHPRSKDAGFSGEIL